MSLISCGSIRESHEWFTDYSRGRQETFVCSAVLLCEQFCLFANGDAKISIKYYFMRSFYFCLSVFSNSEVLGKITSIRSKLPTRLQLAGLGKKGEETLKLMYQSNRGFNISPPRATPGHLYFLQNFCSNSPLPRPKSCSNAPS